MILLIKATPQFLHKYLRIGLSIWNVKTKVHPYNLHTYTFPDSKLGFPIGKYTRDHIPDIATWKGLMEMICLGNLIIFLDALNHKNYWDLTATFVDGVNKENLNKEEIAHEKQRRGEFAAQNRVARQKFSRFRHLFIPAHKVFDPRDPTPLDVNEELFYVSCYSSGGPVTHRYCSEICGAHGYCPHILQKGTSRCGFNA